MKARKEQGPLKIQTSQKKLYISKLCKETDIVKGKHFIQNSITSKLSKLYYYVVNIFRHSIKASLYINIYIIYFVIVRCNLQELLINCFRLF